MAKDTIILNSTTPNISLSTNMAIVSSSATLLNSNQAKEIDSHKEVVRFNRAPVIGYEQYIGSKTTLRVVNDHVLNCIHFGFDRWDPVTQPQYFIRFQKNIKILGFLSKSRADIIYNHIHPSSKLFYTYIDCNFLKKRPTVGFYFIWLCVQAGIVPNLYGFRNELNRTHYWETRDSITPNHDYNEERIYLDKWKKQKKINIL